MLTGQNGILNRAAEAKEKTENANEDEQRKLAQAEALMNTEKTTYKGVTLPEGFAPTKIAGEDSIDDGLVITDGYGNEYVWVEVPKTVAVYQTAGVNISSFTDDEYTKIETDLHTYTSDYKADGYNDTKSSFTKQYKNMLKSVYTNGGFWIGRYEAGISDSNVRTEHINITEDDRAETKPNKIPYNYVTRDEAQILATKMNYENCTSSLIFGIQWDLMLKYIETKNETLKSNLISDSTTIGNYYNSEFALSRGKFAQYGALSNWYAYNSEEKAGLVSGNKKKSQSLWSNGILLTTGASDKTKLQNIYDIAGNVYEWTLEFYSADNPCTYRGGSCSTSGLKYPANYRYINTVDASYSDIGFRIGLWN